MGHMASIVKDQCSRNKGEVVEVKNLLLHLMNVCVTMRSVCINKKGGKMFNGYQGLLFESTSKWAAIDRISSFRKYMRSIGCN